MTRDLSKESGWLPQKGQVQQAIVFFEIKSISGTSSGGVTENEVKQDLANWAPNVCRGSCDHSDKNDLLYSYATNATNTKDIDQYGTFIFQKASGVWNNDIKTSMEKLKLRIVGYGKTYKLVDENPNVDKVDDWEITRWEVQHDVEDNPLNSDPKKLFCDDVTWVKIIRGIKITLITRHGWREY